MGTTEKYYREVISEWNLLTDLYLEDMGWTWDREEMDYVTEDIDLLQLTWGIERCMTAVYFGIDEDEVVSKVLSECNYNDEEEIIKAIRVQLSLYVDKELTEISSYVREEVRRAIKHSKVYDIIKSKADEQVANIKLADKIYKGISNTVWEGSKSKYVDLIRRGLKVTTLRVKKRSRNRSYMDWMTTSINSAVRKELYKNGYKVEQVDSMVKMLGDEINDILNELRWACNDWGIELKILIVPVGLNGFDEDDRVQILTGDEYRYLKSNNIVY